MKAGVTSVILSELQSLSGAKGAKNLFARASAARIVVIMALGALIVLGASTQARADIALCNRFMAFVARARGDATGEFKRRIAFLLDTGKIGEAELSGMLASKTPVSPFGTAQHLDSGILPHERAMVRLLEKSELNWEEVRQFIEELRKGLGASREQGAVHKEATKNVFYPYVWRKVQMPIAASGRPTVFEEDGVKYVIAGGNNGYISIMSVPDGKIRKKIRFETNDLMISADLFKEDGVNHALIASSGARGYVVNLKTGDVVRNYEMPYMSLEGSGSLSKVVIFRSRVEGFLNRLRLGKDERTLAIAGTAPRDLYVFDVMTGRVLKKVSLSSPVRSRPAVFEEGGVVYAIAGTESGMIYVVEPVSGKVLHEIATGEAASSPALFEKEGVKYAVIGSYDGHVYVIDPLKGEVIRKIEAGKIAGSSPALFEENGITYGVVGSKGGSLMFLDISNGKLVWWVHLGDWMFASPLVFRYEGKPYAVIGPAVHEGGLYVIDLFEKKLSKKIAKKIETDEEMETPSEVFEDNGMLYTVVTSKDHQVYVIQLAGDPMVEGATE